MTFDIILVSGDAYIDHPSFGTALIARYLEKHGFSVGIIDQPDWKTDQDFLKLGKPKLFFGVSAGNLDSMVANYTADKKIRRNDMYSPNNEAGHRPDRATIVYTSKLKHLFPGVPIVLGGVEASLRRFAHYDFWSDKVRRSVLFDAKADYLVYGMGEKGILEIAKILNPKSETLNKSELPKSKIPNTAIIVKDIAAYKDALVVPSFEEVSSDKKKFAEASKLYYLEGRKKHPRIIIQHCQGRYLVVFPPQNLSPKELDQLFEMPFKRAPHPKYKNTPIPAWGFVKHSTISHRGCFGGCAFCAISQHHGKYIISRSPESIKKEIEEKIVPRPDFKGTILDVGGPTANMYGITCLKADGCTRASCIYPNICPSLDFSQKPSLKLMQELRQLPGVKHLFINSGIRYDLALLDNEYLDELVKYHISGQLSVAPEHICEEVLLMMGKPKINKFLEFKDKFIQLNKKHKKKQFLIPYFIASHPGSTLKHALDLSLFLKKHKLRIEQVQNFTPTPMTISTCMYYTGLNPFTGKAVHVPKSEERSFQKALLQPYLKNNYRLVAKALKQMGKTKLIKELI
ncbi:MAG: YgiQ family radical SAM protein [Candidatus Margulisbacteria bacterium]|nr:YgiQ family radical SAM protein [Candidatus Margulisiibacteriota bacterium]MBU1021616.1 YgiQ family radical SAM protein [Candidatus Margulisiibacteriota bacterium]MBU1728766.1 YgiQ family radical SAM protein [Candidatus Margulisiibacteriota bacterium]MBU1955732.1 YgiQ family radical SAM protein [Candidatus Margulisiibacteriota bacterium]